MFHLSIIYLTNFLGKKNLENHCMTLENILLYILKWVNYGWFLSRKRFTWLHAVASDVGTGIFFETLPSYFLIVSSPDF